MRDCIQRRERINKAITDLAAFSSTALLNPFIELLDALEEEAIADLIAIQPEKLQRKQGIVAQLAALKATLRNPEQYASPIAV